MTKRFSNIAALDSVDFTAWPGEVTGLIGATGAGKSTLCQVIAGRTQPDSGKITAGGPVALIHGTPALAGDRTVAANVWLGNEPRRLGMVNRAEMIRNTRYALARLDSRIDPRTLAGQLPPEHQRVVEIARALASGARVVVLDDPAAIMPVGRMDVLLAAVRRLAASGVAVVYASDRACELAKVADRVTVLRAGRVSGPHPVGNAVDVAALVFAHESVPGPVHRDSVEAPVLDVHGLKAGHLVADISFDVRAGETVALVGAEAGEALAGVVGAVSGSGRILVHGKPMRFQRPSAAARAGIGYLAPESDLLASRSVGGNVAVAQPRRGWICRSQGRRMVSVAEKLLRTGLPGADRLVAGLPTRERRRVALARSLVAEFEILLIAAPLDHDQATHRMIRELAAAGVAVVLASGVITDVLPVADRIVLLRDGRTLRDVDVPALSTQDVIRMSAGVL